MTDPASDLVVFLAANVSGLTDGTNIFVGQPRAASSNVPKDAVFVEGIGGPPAVRVMGRSLETRTTALNIMVRDQRQQDGRNLAQSIIDELLNASVSGYLDVKSEQPEPTPMGETDDGLHRWVVIASMMYVQSPPGIFTDDFSQEFA